MEKLLNDEYYHLGTKSFYKELWLYPQMDQIHKSYIKPLGGIWTSHTNPFTLSDWIGYKEELEDFNNEFLSFMQSSLLKFKTDSKLLKIENNIDYKNLKDSGFIKILETPIKIQKWYSELFINEIIDYEKISEYYDLMYVTDYAHKNLSNFSVRTMFALNPECIDYYKPLNVNYENHKILKTEDKTYLTEPDTTYYKLIDYVRSLFSIINEKDYDRYIELLIKETKAIENILLKNINNINLSLPNKIDKSEVIKTIIKNVYREQYIDKQKKLLKK